MKNILIIFAIVLLATDAALCELYSSDDSRIYNALRRGKRKKKKQTVKLPPADNYRHNVRLGLFFDYPQSQYLLDLNKIGYDKNILRSGINIAYYYDIYEYSFQIGLETDFNNIFTNYFIGIAAEDLQCKFDYWDISLAGKYYFTFFKDLNLYFDGFGGMLFADSQVGVKTEREVRAKGGRRTTVSSFDKIEGDDASVFIYGAGAGVSYLISRGGNAGFGAYVGARYIRGESFSINLYEKDDAEEYKTTKFESAPDFLSMRIGIIIYIL